MEAIIDACTEEGGLVARKESMAVDEVDYNYSLANEVNQCKVTLSNLSQTGKELCKPPKNYVKIELIESTIGNNRKENIIGVLIEGRITNNVPSNINSMAGATGGQHNYTPSAKGRTGTFTILRDEKSRNEAVKMLSLAIL